MFFKNQSCLASLTGMLARAYETTCNVLRGVNRCAENIATITEDVIWNTPDNGGGS